jgi:hypothetical protein
MQIDEQKVLRRTSRATNQWELCSRSLGDNALFTISNLSRLAIQCDGAQASSLIAFFRDLGVDSYRTNSNE